MTASQKRAQRGVNRGGVSLVGISVSPGVDGVVVGDTVVNDDFARRRADSLDAEAEYYRQRAVQEERALGSGYLRRPAPGHGYRRAAMAQRIRTRNAAT